MKTAYKMVTKAIYRRETCTQWGKGETPSQPTMNSGPGIAKPREVEGIALSQPLLVPEE